MSLKSRTNRKALATKTTAEIVDEIGIPLHRVYYLENKGYIKPIKRSRGEREFRYYRERDVELIRLIWKYYKEDGLRYTVAYQKALEALRQPSLDIELEG